MSQHRTAAEEYYAAFRGSPFVIKGSGTIFQEENDAIGRGVLQAIRVFREHEIPCLLVHGGGPQLDKAMGSTKRHSETKLRVTPAHLIPVVEQERQAISRRIAALCKEIGIPFELLHPSVCHAERILDHGETGRIVHVQRQAIMRVLGDNKLAVMPFGGMDDSDPPNYLNVNADANATESAREIRAQKLIFLTNEDGIYRPNGNGDKRKISFLDFDAAVRLIRERNASGEFVVSDGMLPKLDASIRAVAGGVEQVHILQAGGAAMLQEVLTRTGAGTLIEYVQRQQIERASPEDLDAILELREECSAPQFSTPHGTTYLKPLEPSQVQVLIPSTLVLRHRGIPVGTIYFSEVDGHPGTVMIGGFAVGENHQNSQYGRMLLEEALKLIVQRGYPRAISITASPEVQRLFAKYGQLDEMNSFGDVSQRSKQRYAREDRDLVRTYVFQPPRDTA